MTGVIRECGCLRVLLKIQRTRLMEMNTANALYFAVKSLMHAMRNEDKDAPSDVAHRMIQFAKPWTIMRWSQSKLVNRNPLVRIP